MFKKLGEQAREMIQETHTHTCNNTQAIFMSPWLRWFEKLKNWKKSEHERPQALLNEMKVRYNKIKCVYEGSWYDR